MIRHFVMLALPDNYDRAVLAEIMRDIDKLRGDIPGFMQFEHGVNKNFEGLSNDCSYAFMCGFRNEATSRAFIVSPGHSELGQRLVEICEGGADGIKIVDMETAA